ncbi:hypothetical protein MFIFM68171_03875 [Madurella fahalii]|uniref:Uncharacterized protein n=1 Tax=Madurella fahalii TaxID=1157608 RepID=A0ABQ0G7U4_9PEZI
MSSSGKDFDATSLASDASLLRDKDGKSESKTKKRSLLSRLAGSRKGASGSGTSSASSNTAAATAAASPSSSSQQAQAGQAQSNAVEDLHKAYPNLGVNTRLT